MIRTQVAPLLKTLAVSARSSSTHHVLLASGTLGMRRALSSSTSENSSLKSKAVNETASRGAEGPHYADDGTLVKGAELKVHSEVTGDWVLFHPVYTKDEMKVVTPVVHRDERKFSDKYASLLVKIMRTGFDLVSGYKHKEIPAGSTMSLEELRKKGYVMTEKGWLNRVLFLETVAGIPGMVAATIRHLHSLRLMRRDAGWIHTLLEEAENERMHLMTFMALKKPGLLFRALVLGAQGVFYNVFFLSYLISPRICHRFVGYLEEEAVKTYSTCISDLENGRFPEWENKPAPGIAKDYWRLAPDATIVDMIYAIRSDEATHRFVNHSLANLNSSDVNPFAMREPDMTVKGLKYGFERDESAKYVKESQRLIKEQQT
ncbi:alternative oxidase [Phellopilus nigrolimitatus]|nr:alternative oxidase [Phellopilus nigrolimitatus]